MLLLVSSMYSGSSKQPVRADHPGSAVGIGAGILWLVDAAALGLIGIVSTYVSAWLFIPFGLWGLLAATLGLKSVRADPTAKIRLVSAIAGVGSAVAAALIAIATPGSELLWSVALGSGLAGLYSLLAVRLGKTPIRQAGNDVPHGETPLTGIARLEAYDQITKGKGSTPRPR